MPTVAEVLKQSGFSDEQIAAIDPKVIQGVTQVLSTAEQLKEAAENEKRHVQATWNEEINPALTRWAQDSTNLTAERDYYKTLAIKAQEGGFTPAAPPFTPPAPSPRTADGRFVTGANQVPGSPDFVKLKEDIGGAFSFAADTQWKYRTLYGREMPDSPTQIIREATAQRMDPVSYAAKKYDFAAKETQIKADEQKKHDDAIRKEASDAKDKEWAEKIGSNPNIRQAEVSRFSQVAQAVKKGERKDTTLMNPEERRQYTREQIHKDIAANETVQ